jgi:hypothetical protein
MGIANVVALKKFVSQQQHQTAPLYEVAKAINIKLRLADEKEHEARNHRLEAGEMLVTLRKRVEANDQDWWKFAKDHFDRTRRELEKLMTYVPAGTIAKAAISANPGMSDRAIAEKIGVSQPTVSRARERTTDTNVSVEKRTGKDGKAPKLPEPKAKPNAKPQPIVLLTDTPCTDCGTRQEFWQRSVFNMAGEAVSLTAYWKQQFGSDWEKFEVPSDMLTLVRQAVEEWQGILENLVNRKEGRVAPQNSNQPQPILATQAAKPSKRSAEQAEPQIDPSTLSITAQEKLAAAIRQHQRKLDAEFEQRVREACQRGIEETVLPHYNETYAIYQDLIKARKGLMDRATYRKILSCLHPDRVPDEMKKRYEEAFHLFSQLEKRVLNEKESPTATMPMPRTYEAMMARKREVSEQRRAKREVARAATSRPHRARTTFLSGT